MGRPRVSDGFPISLRLDAAMKERLEALRGTLAPAGTGLSLTQALRAALTAGLDALNAPAATTTPRPAAVQAKAPKAKAPAGSPRPRSVRNDPGDLPDRMRAWRALHDLTTRDAGERAGISHATWARIEGGTYGGRASTLDLVRAVLAKK